MTRFIRRLRGVLRREARELMRGGPPTDELLRPVGPEVPSDTQVLQVLDLCMGVGEVLLSSGEPAGETSATMLRLAAACGLPTVDVDITFASITMCCHRGMVAAPVTTMRLVHYRTTDLTRLALVTGIVDQVMRGRMPVQTAAAALTDAVAARHPYPRWVATTGWAGLAAAVALLLGGSPIIGLTAFVVTGFIDRLGRLLSRWGVASFLLQLVGAMVATVCTLGLFAVGALPPGTQPSLVIAAGITVLLSGLSVVGTVQDAISRYYFTAAGRATEIALLSAGLLTGVILGLQLGLLVRLTLNPAEPVGADVAHFGISTFAAATAAGMFALACYAPLRSLPAAGLTGGDRLGRLRRTHPVRASRPGSGHRCRGHRRRRGDRPHPSRHQRAPPSDHPVRDHPAAPGAHRISRLLPVGHPRGGGRPGHHHARASHRPRPRRRCGARRLHRPAPHHAGCRLAGCEAHGVAYWPGGDRVPGPPTPRPRATQWAVDLTSSAVALLLAVLVAPRQQAVMCPAG
jgi:uncharacterized membrane protein YjjP (DUF1212 family)